MKCAHDQEHYSPLGRHVRQSAICNLQSAIYNLQSAIYNLQSEIT
ncbi:hypothetical protein [Candidatus Viridilinea mediisalina]|nr:hypothetical protein [Candidatus Viridilinea mediisalina]